MIAGAEEGRGVEKSGVEWRGVETSGAMAHNRETPTQFERLCRSIHVTTLSINNMCHDANSLDLTV